MSSSDPENIENVPAILPGPEIIPNRLSVDRFALDFAGAWLDFPPRFSDEVWEDWQRKNEAQFGEDWPEAQAILGELEELGIYMLDPSPSNFCFR